MKKLLILIIGCFAYNHVINSSYLARYDRGYWGDDYSQRAAFLTSNKIAYRDKGVDHE